MILGNRLARVLAASLACALALSAASAAPAAERKVAVVAFGLYGDQSVFESEANGAARMLADRLGGDPVIVRANTKSRADVTVKTLGTTLRAVAAGMDRKNDILALTLTSHGAPVGLAVKAGRALEVLSPSELAAALARTGVRHRIVIISACYSGVFIPALANADTLVITAADAKHPSFGCRDGAVWTYFGDAFFNKALRRKANLREAFALAHTLVRARELRQHFAP